VIGFVTDQAKNKIKEKNLLVEQKEVENSGEDAGKVFHQSPEPDEEVAKGSTVLLFIAKKPKTP
jgi:beta-lactam-binding protein with PASTA domain